MNRPSGILFHTFKGIQFWSKRAVNLDVARINYIQLRHRVFTFFDSDRPYLIETAYVNYRPMSYFENPYSISIYSFRYSSFEEAKDDLDWVLEKQKRLDKCKQLWMEQIKSSD